MTDEDQLEPFSVDEIRLATSNYESQEWLTRELFSAFQMCDMSVQDLAEKLDLDPAEVDDWLSGDADLSMSDLRHLATALDAHVTYSVEPVVTRLPQWLSELNHVGWATASQNSWAPDRLAHGHR